MAHNSRIRPVGEWVTPPGPPPNVLTAAEALSFDSGQANSIGEAGGAYAADTPIVISGASGTNVSSATTLDEVTELTENGNVIVQDGGTLQSVCESSVLYETTVAQDVVIRTGGELAMLSGSDLIVGDCTVAFAGTIDCNAAHTDLAGEHHFTGDWSCTGSVFIADAPINAFTVEAAVPVDITATDVVFDGGETPGIGFVGDVGFNSTTDSLTLGSKSILDAFGEIIPSGVDAWTAWRYRVFDEDSGASINADADIISTSAADKDYTIAASDPAPRDGSVITILGVGSSSVEGLDFSGGGGSTRFSMTIQYMSGSWYKIAWGSASDPRGI